MVGLIAGSDIYLAQQKNLERFVQVGYDTLDTGDNGITGEPNPVRHREIAKKLAPAFSTRNLKAKEVIVLKHINVFIEKIKETGACERGIEMRSWTDRLGLDLSADMVYGREMKQVEGSKCLYRSSPMKWLNHTSEGLDSPLLHSKAQFVPHNEPGHQKIPPLSPTLPHHFPICLVHHATAHQDALTGLQTTPRASRRH